MRILDEQGNQLRWNGLDYRLGRLKQETLLQTVHPPQPPVAEQFHYVTVKEYPNGGRELERVIDVPAQPGQPARQEYEEIFRFVPHDKQVLAQLEAEAARQAERNKRLEALLQEDLTDLVEKLVWAALTGGALGKE